MVYLSEHNNLVKRKKFDSERLSISKLKKLIFALMTCDPPGLMPMSCNPATPTWCQLLCYIALHHWCPDLCQIGAQTRVRSVPRLVPPWCPCPHGSLLIAGGMPPVPLSGLPGSAVPASEAAGVSCQRRTGLHGPKGYFGKHRTGVQKVQPENQGPAQKSRKGLSGE